MNNSTRNTSKSQTLKLKELINHFIQLKYPCYADCSASVYTDSICLICPIFLAMDSIAFFKIKKPTN